MWLFLSLAIAQACHPECTYQCDDPVCPASCVPVCLRPVCEVCVNSSSLICYPLDGCYVRCPADMCESDSCPQCETICSSNACLNIPNCTVLCEEVQCAWQCSKPTNCPYPTCLLQCEMPACPFSGATHSYTMLLLLTLLPLFIHCIS